MNHYYPIWFFHVSGIEKVIVWQLFVYSILSYQIGRFSFGMNLSPYLFSCCSLTTYSRAGLIFRIWSCHIILMEVIIWMVQKIQMTFSSLLFAWVSAVKGITWEVQGNFISGVIGSYFPCFVLGGSSMLWSMNYRSVVETSQPQIYISCHLVKLNSFCWIFSSLNRMEGNECPLLPIRHSGFTVISSMKWIRY